MAPRRRTSKEAKPATAKLRTPLKPSKPAAKTKAAKAQKAAKAIWADKVFVLSGDLHSQYTHGDIERWIIYHGGRVEKEVTSETTHLICSMEDFRNKVTHVKEAFKLGQVRCKIVGYSYIEECLLNPRKPKRLYEKPYLLSRELTKKRKEGKGPELTEDGYIKDIEKSKELVDPKLYRIYCDSTFFEYKVVLTRSSTDYKGKISLEKYTIFLFESRAWPHLYTLGIKYQKGNRPMVLERDRNGDKLFDVALKQFKTRFKDKTGIEWDQRLDRLPQVEDHYVYTPPTGGKPVGVLPKGWQPPPDLEPEQQLDGETETKKVSNGDDCIMVDPDLRDDTDSEVDTVVELSKHSTCQP